MEKEILIKRIKWRMETMLIKYKKWVKEKNNEKKRDENIGKKWENSTKKNSNNNENKLKTKSIREKKKKKTQNKWSKKKKKKLGM